MRTALPEIRAATRSYESWCGEQCPLIRGDLRRKHELMASAFFDFFRGTFYRWMQHWPGECPELVTAANVLAVGDLHVANFGTWRDQDDRLVWGVNDFDEAHELPYTVDLVRLAASAVVAIKMGYLPIGSKTACHMLLRAYAAALEAGGEPT